MVLPIEFRPAALSDLPLLAQWLMEPHVRRFYQKAPISLPEVEAEYGPMIRGETLDIVNVALAEGIPFGYLQCYRNLDNPDYAKLIGANGGISMDLYIGEPGYVGRGYGRAMLCAYLRQIAFPYFANETRAYIAHEPVNLAARRCSEAVGFRPVREFVEDGLPNILHVLERSALEERIPP